MNCALVRREIALSGALAMSTVPSSSPGRGGFPPPPGFVVGPLGPPGPPGPLDPMSPLQLNNRSRGMIPVRIASGRNRGALIGFLLDALLRIIPPSRRQQLNVPRKRQPNDQHILLTTVRPVDESVNQRLQ